MITNLGIENYRGFKTFNLQQLSRVNLLVGMNNCGKTSILEAVHLVASAGDVAVLNRFALQRGEYVFASDEPERVRRDIYPDASHFFYGHEFRPGITFHLSADNGFGSVACRVVEPRSPEDSRLAQGRLFEDEEIAALTYLLEIEASRLHERAPLLVPVTADGAFSVERYRRIPRTELERAPPVQFITPESLEPPMMGLMWDRAVKDRREPEVIRAMQILERDLTDIFFLSGERSRYANSRGGILVGFAGAARRLPLGSQGGGMRRLLALSLSLIHCEGGVLLIDEIDTGLHWSIMGDMWSLVVQAARQANVQVIATTHSLDCLKGLEWLYDNHRELAAEVSVHKIDRALGRSVALSANQVRLALEQGIEVR